MGILKQLGIATGILWDGVDQSAVFNAFNVPKGMETVDVTTFDPTGIRAFFRDYIAGLRTATVSETGFLPITYAQALALMETLRTGVNFLVGVNAFAPGDLALFGKAFSTQVVPPIEVTGAIGLQRTHQTIAGSPNLCTGVSLLTPFGVGGTSADEAHSLTATAATGNATIYGNITVTPGEANSALQTAIRAKGGNYANVTVSGSTDRLDDTGSGNGTASASDSTESPDGAFADDNTMTRWVSENSALPHWLQWDFGAANAKTIHAYTLYLDTNDGAPVNFQLLGSATGVFGGEEMVLHSNSSQLPFGVNSFAIGSPASFRYYRLNITSVRNGMQTQVYEMQLLGTRFSGTYAIAGFPTATNVDDIEASPGTNWAGLVTQQGGAMLPNYATHAAAFNGTTVRDIGLTETSNRGAVIALHVLQAGTTATFRVQHAPNNAGVAGTWATLGTFPAVTAAGAYTLAIAAGTTINPFIRIIIPTSGVTGSFVAAAAFCRL